MVNEGFDNWSRVNQGKKCAFVGYVGYAASSSHTMCVKKSEDLMRHSQHIEKVMHAQTKEEKKNNCLLLRTSIISVRWLTL